MATETLNLDLHSLPRVLQKYADQIPYATSVALNTTAFGLMREEKEQLSRHLELRNTWTQRGERVVKSSKHSLQAEVGNIRWYIETLAEGGTRRARVGIRHNGKKYLLVPAKGRKTKTGRLRKIPKGKKPFVIEVDGKKILVYRKGKKRYPLVTVGLLVLETHYEDDTYPWEQVASDYVQQAWPKNWRRAMLHAARTAR